MAEAVVGFIGYPMLVEHFHHRNEQCPQCRYVGEVFPRAPRMNCFSGGGAYSKWPASVRRAAAIFVTWRCRSLHWHAVPPLVALLFRVWVGQSGSPADSVIIACHKAPPTAVSTSGTHSLLLLTHLTASLEFPPRFHC